MTLYILLFFLGIVIGIIGTLIGAGGGFILIPILLFLYPAENPETLTSISLIVIFVNALSGTIAYIRMKKVNFKYGLIFSAASLPGAIIGAFLTKFISRDIFSLIFGFILLAVSIFIFFKSPAETYSLQNNQIILTKPKLLVGILISGAVGMIANFLGIGGGVIHVPVLSNILLFPVHNATATSHFILAITSLAGIIVHVINGKFHHGLTRAVFISGGVLIGAQFGALLSSKIRGMIIIKILAIALFIVGIRLMTLFFY